MSALTDLLYCSAIGLFCAIAYEFGWAAIRSPLVLMEVPLAMFALAILFLTRKNRQRAIR
jgi:hypothetical protein